MGQYEFHRADQMRRGAHQPLAFVQRLMHQPEFVAFEIPQPAMDELGRGGRGVAGEIVLFDEQHRQPVQRRLARDRAAVDPAADDQDVVRHRVCLIELLATPSPRTCSGVHQADCVNARLCTASLADRWTPEQVRGDAWEWLVEAAGTAYIPHRYGKETKTRRASNPPADPRFHRNHRYPRGQAGDRARFWANRAGQDRT
ncbi:hypothetical protein SPHINGOAX6_10061 [Sphingomonas sp. AX6]|nr:hypothetical protein SPHINGOAX6_10061 [Sphingomonas sp. AX6]